MDSRITHPDIYRASEAQRYCAITFGFNNLHAELDWRSSCEPFL